ncbi:MAG: acetylxylan esterase [Bacteroidaceae bacterium]|nr:acetylxylan esterase [Bacteroidaceae bacterium]
MTETHYVCMFLSIKGIPYFVKHLISRNFIVSFWLCLFGVNVSAQNILPYYWRINFKNDTSVNTRHAKAHSIVSTLLSWERQGYFAGDGDCTLTSNFEVKDANLKYVLTIRLQCDVNSLRINGKYIASDLKNQFWSDKKTFTQLPLKKGILKKGKNTITIYCSSLGYTGGISHSLLTVTPAKDKSNERLLITLPTRNHVCLGEEDKIATIHYFTSQESSLRLRIETDFHQPCIDTLISLSPKDTLVHIDLNRICEEPEFYQITAVMHGEGYTGNVQWMAVKPEEVSCNNQTIRGFDDYWDKAKAELAAISPNFRMHKVDSLCRKSQRDVYIVEMQSLGNLTIRGYYFVPRTEGKHITVLQVPGYGWGFENIDDMLNAKTNRIELALCVRGHGISADVFNPGFETPGVWGYKLYNSDSIAYRAIYMDCVRAVDFLCSRPEVDIHRIAVKGGSQGGGLTLATAALCSDKIAACAYFDPFPCDMRHQIRIRTTCETELKNNLSYYGNPCSFGDAMNVQDLIDTRSFASEIKCPVLYTAALFDDDCPVHGGFTAYNLIKSPKQYKVFPNDGHIEGFAHDAIIMNWIDTTLSSKISN